MLAPIKVSPAATMQIQQAAQQAGAADLALRLAATRQPDGGIDYLMGFDAIQPTDIKVEISDDRTLVFAPTYQNLLVGMTLDYVELAPGQFNFIFINPNDAHYQPPHEA